jgi:acetyltransferase-like isoleucine patch superfamily enzyme
MNSAKVDEVGVKSLLACRVERRKKGGMIKIGDGCVISGVMITERENSFIDIGNNVFVGGNTTFDCVERISIEDDVLISYGCLIADSDNHNIHYEIRKNDLRDWMQNGGHDWTTIDTKPVHVGKGVWLGAREVVLKGVTICEGAVEGAGNVGARDVPSKSGVAGNPARVIRKIEIHG